MLVDAIGMRHNKAKDWDGFLRVHWRRHRNILLKIQICHTEISHPIDVLGLGMS